ncbi:MAG: low molecular weight protein-tyrosine-phosphatase [Pseudomonadota bacterium]
MTVKVLFVCLGNICRSPTAHGLFQHYVDQAKLGHKLVVDSAGTGDWHLGDPPDERAQATAVARGYNISHLRARQVTTSDFIHFDYILAMDQQNLRDLSKLKPANFKGTLGLFLDVAGLGDNQDVPDPYYGDQSHFNYAIELIDTASQDLLARIQQDINAR